MPDGRLSALGAWVISGRDVAGWVRAALKVRRPPPTASNGSVVLAFPNRVSLRLVDGRVLTAEVDLVPCTFALPGAEAALERKFLQTAGLHWGEPAARHFFTRALALGVEETTRSLFEPLDRGPSDAKTALHA
jgi:hypothetical protein